MTNQASKDDDRLHRTIERMIIENRADGADYIDTSDQASLAYDIQSLIRTEKLKLLTEVRERVVGENDKAGRLAITLTVGRNQLRDTQRTELTKLEAEL